MRWVLLTAVLLGACTRWVAPPDSPSDYLRFVDGDRWTCVLENGPRKTTLAQRVAGGDMRTLDGKDVRYQFVYGTPSGMDDAAAKSIIAMAESGPREFYFDGWVWSLYHDPPIPLLPEAVAPGVEWTWRGRLETHGFEGDTEATLRITKRERVTVPAGRFDALRVVATYSGGGPTITRWYAKGVGLVRLEITHAGKPPQTLMRTAPRR